MGKIPQHFIDDLIARADIVEVVGRRVQLKKAGREFKANCPFHDEKTPSFTVSPGKGFYHCFGCGAHGTAIGFLMEHDRPAQRNDELFELMRRAQLYFEDQLKNSPAAVDYLKARGVDGVTAKRFGVGYAPEGWSNVLDKFGTSKEAIERLLGVGLIIQKDNGRNYDRFRERIMFPIRDSRGRNIGFGGRVLGNGDRLRSRLSDPERLDPRLHGNFTGFTRPDRRFVRSSVWWSSRAIWTLSGLRVTASTTPSRP